MCLGNIMIQMGKTFIIIGTVLIAAGVFFIFGSRIPFLGKLPGDIFIKRDNFSLYFPLTTSILLSVVLSLLFWIFRSK